MKTIARCRGGCPGPQLAFRSVDAGADVLRCGEALSAVLLECTLAGLATCTLTPMTLPSRDIIRQLTGQIGSAGMRPHRTMSEGHCALAPSACDPAAPSALGG
jgi:hypothetical protein